jgi:hypothetical protein
MKPEVVCPHCGSELANRAGVRKLRNGVAQRFRCNTCGGYFSDRELKHKSYDARTILRAVSLHNLGHTLEGTKREMGRRFHQRIPLSTIRSWVKEYSHICTYSKLRERGRRLHPPADVILSKRLEHGQVYDFKLHRAKLEVALSYPKHQRFSALKDYLLRIPTEAFPHHIFARQNGTLEQRASRLKVDLLEVRKLERHNLANRLAELGLMLARTNRERHSEVEEFMLVNDSCTVACEVPVYLTCDDIEYFKSRGFTIDFENYQTPITGHIDILQVRNGLIHVLDYKPEASGVDPVEQLTTYALALASRTKLAVRDFKCAWFDGRGCFEFFPLHAVRSGEVIYPAPAKIIHGGGDGRCY